MKQWYVAYVRMHHEKKTAAQLQELGVEHFLPLQEVVRQWSDRKKKIQQVIIPMMIFIRAEELERITLLQKIPSLLNYLALRHTHRPAIISDTEMDRFRFMLNYSEEAVHFISEPLQAGAQVTVCKGPLKGLEGELVQANNTTQVSLRISQLGCALVEIPVGYLEIKKD